MQFLNPSFFLLTIFIIAVILFYFFRKQYVEQLISSNYLWEQVLNEWQASPWLKKLQQNLLFWLQLIALILLMLALVKPYWSENAVHGEHIVIIIDSSASMSADYEDNNRFLAAKKKALELVEKLGGQEVTVIEASEKPEILLSQETDQAVIRKIINKMELSYGHEQIEKAMNLAVSLSSSMDTAIHIFSDRVTKSQVNEHMKEQYVEVHNIGETVDNLSLLSFGVTPINEQVSGVAVIENQASSSKEVEFSVKSEDEILFQRKLSIQGNEQLVVQIPSLLSKPYYEAVIMNKDGYMADNSATSILTDSNQKVYMIGELNAFAVKGFQTIGAELIRTDLANVQGNDLNGIVVAEENTLQNIPNQPLILFNNNTEKSKLTERLVGVDDRLLQYVNYEKIFIDSAIKPLEGEWETILRSGEHPLVQKGKINGQSIVVINFSLSDSDWPLQPGFPIFLYNTYEWLSQQTDFLGYFTPGEEKWINFDERNQVWGIFTNENENLYTIDLAKTSFKAPSIPGVYQAVSGDKIYYFSVMLDDREKQANVEQAFKQNEIQLEEKGQTSRPNDKIWFLFAILALGLIALEWEVYRRGHRV